MTAFYDHNDSPYSYSDFDEEGFKDHVRKALASVERVLDTDRSASVKLAGDVDHSYGDKYRLANTVTNTAIVATLRVLRDLGLSRDKLATIAGAASSNKQAVTLRFAFETSSSFIKEEIVDKPIIGKKTTTTTTETSGSKDFGTDDVEKTTETSKTETIVDRQIKKHYDHEAQWELSVYRANNTEDRTILGERTCSTKVVRGTSRSQNVSGFANSGHTVLELPLTWLLRQIDIDIDAGDSGIRTHFAIDTSLATTKTPYRNAEVGEALRFFRRASTWAKDVLDVVDKLADHCHKDTTTSDSDSVDDPAYAFEWLDEVADDIFLPSLPFLAEDGNNLEEGNPRPRLESAASAAAVSDGNNEAADETEAWIRPEVGAADEESSGSRQQHQEEQQLVAATDDNNNQNTADGALVAPVVSASDFTHKFLNEHARTLSETRGKIRSRFPDPSATEDAFLSSLEATLVVSLGHTMQLATCLAQSLRYLEVLLEKQLVSAIGKEVTSSDLDKYVRYHNVKLLDPSPRPFCYAIRRPGHYPDGILGIEEMGWGGTTVRFEAITTHVREVPNHHPIEVPLNAATTIELTGKTYVHGWLKHRFGGVDGNHARLSESVRLNARARQFSSFVLLVGTMVNRHKFRPRDAIILRNKDEVHIPLLLNEIPTATEFKSAIHSLSPEQQRFARSYRSMQLDSSMLGVCVVQIKPQLERLLGLPPRALTKEMKLTEDLTELFVEYQVPSDLVSCDDSDGSEGEQTPSDKVASVKAHVQAVLDVIAAQKKEQLEQEVQQAEMRMAENVPKAVPGAGRVRRRPVMLCSTSRTREDVTNYAMGASQSVDKPASLSKAVRLTSFKTSFKTFGRKATDLGEMQDSYMAREEAQDECTEELPTAHNEDGSRENPSNTGVAKPGEDSMNNSDFMAIPKILDRAIEQHAPNAAIRSTTIETDSNNWTRISQKNLLTKSTKETLSKDKIATETARAFDLLDALSRSGSLAIACSELHVVICATHRFERSVMDTVIVDNVNPIEKLELSTLLMASTILGRPARELVRECGDGGLGRLEASFPRLLGAAPDGGNGSAGDDDPPRNGDGV